VGEFKEEFRQWSCLRSRQSR